MGMRIVRKIEAVFCPLMLVLSLFVILKLKILPAYGIQLTVNTTGTSMNPTIKEGCLAIYDENYPFEDVKVGDIICFKERPFILAGSASSTITFTLGTPDSTEPSSESSSTVPSSKEDVDADTFSGEDIETAETAGYRDSNIQYTGGLVMHRVVEINEICRPGSIHRRRREWL